MLRSDLAIEAPRPPGEGRPPVALFYIFVANKKAPVIRRRLRDIKMSGHDLLSHGNCHTTIGAERFHG